MFIVCAVLIDVNLISIRFFKTSSFYLYAHIICSFLINIIIWVDIILRNAKSYLIYFY
jgi:hypothetical protein